MNKKEFDILRIIKQEKNVSQRKIAEITGYSLGTVNASIKKMIEKRYIYTDMKLTELAKKYIKEESPKNAIILAAGFGMRMVPINLERPKGLLEVNGETLIERIIKQLRDVGIKDIYIVVGFMKEAYEYLIDEYKVKLIINNEYVNKNNLHSLKYALNYLSNTYIIPCDIWCEENPFNKDEFYSWYMISKKNDKNSIVRLNSKEELVKEKEKGNANKMIGISYLDKKLSEFVKTKVNTLCKNIKFDNAFWEEALFEKNKMKVFAKKVDDNKVCEINTYEQLRDLDDKSRNLESEAVTVAANAFNVKTTEITNIKVLKKGMTNRSFLFTCKNKEYIMRIPGEGTDKLINREEEAEVYDKIKDISVCDNIIYINPKNGYKITEFFENARVCDAFNKEDVKKCMKRLKEFHEKKIKVGHEFDIFKQINFYEKLWDGQESIYKDYKGTKEKVFSLKEFIDKNVKEKYLTHIDAVPDNFLFIKDKNGKEDIRLIDWEYAGMQDQCVDIAMFAIYALYSRKQLEKLIDYYYDGKCDRITKIKIYCYVAACGLLWSNWCEYKRNLGVDFGDYSIAQYRYAKEYYKIVKEELERKGDDKIV